MLVPASQRRQGATDPFESFAQSARSPSSLLSPYPQQQIFASKPEYDVAGCPFGPITSGPTLKGTMLQMGMWTRII